MTVGMRKIKRDIKTGINIACNTLSHHYATLKLYTPGL